ARFPEPPRPQTAMLAVHLPAAYQRRQQKLPREPPLMGKTLFDSPAFANPEGVHAVFDEKTGLRGMLAVHSTARGPAGGGTRMWNYATSAEALEDVLRLSKGMSYKNAVADLEMGGGKSVIIGDSRTQKTPELFRAFARYVDQLGGVYYAAED